MLGLHATPDSFRLNQCPPAASAPAPGSHTSHQNGTCPGDFSLIRVAPGLFRQQVWRQFQSRDFLRRHFQPRGILCFGMGLSTFDYVPVAERRMWVCTLPLIERLVRIPLVMANQSPLVAIFAAPGIYTARSLCCHSFLRGPTFGDRLSRFSSLPGSSTSASRLVDAGVNQATLLTIANAVVTRRRAKVCTLPLSLQASLRASRSPTACTGHPIAVDQSQVGRPSISPSCLGIFSAPGSAKFSRVSRSRLFSTPSHFSLATPGPVYGPFTRLRRCNSAVH